jgi:16S rRNA (adenine1518-N6/adenine1519-N6)-dimethyltransferase
MKIYEIKALIKRYGLRLNKRLGQNFLTNPLYLQRIVQAAELNAEDIVLEVGPGLGPLTELLLEVVQQVVAVEVDRGFTHILQDRFAERTNLVLYHEDILKTNIRKLLQPISQNEMPSYKCVANIPYYITSAVMRHLLESESQPELIVLLMQKEVAQRIIAQPGKLSLLAVGVQFYGQPEIIDTIPAGSFYPVPKVDSAILRVRPYPEKRYAVEEGTLFWRVVKAGFGQKRKQLKNSLKAGLPQFNAQQVQTALQKAEIDIKRRAQTLTIEEWVRLYEAFALVG